MTPRLAVVLLLGAATVAGCGEPRSVSTSCRKDAECPAGAACRVGACIPRISGAPQVWAVEMLPRSESSWALTENTSVSFSAEPVTLKVERTVSVDGTISGVELGTNSSGSSTLRVVITVASPVDRRYEGSGATRGGAGPVEFSVRVPESALGRPARVRVIPDAPVDRTLPPWTSTVNALGRTLTLAAPTADQVDTIEGILETPFAGEAVAGYVVRGLVGTRLVTNVERTAVDGRFKLRVPRAPYADVAKLSEITLDLTPGDPMEAVPKLVVKVTNELAAKLVDGKLALPTLRLPPSPPAQMFDIPVTGPDSKQKLPGVTLRFHTVVPGAVGGAEAVYVREAQTDREGVARVALLPGNAGETRTYSVAAFPGPTSEFAARCVSSYAVAAGGGARVGASIALPPKVELAGNVMDHLGFAGAAVTVTAARTDTTLFEDCRSEVAAAPLSMVTKADGAYRLLLEPGRYRVEYEPNMGSASALLLEEDVAVDASRRRDVALPPGVVAEGSIVNPDGGPVTGCEIRVLDLPRDATMPRQRRARALTGADGRFQVVLPSAGAAPPAMP